MSAQRDTSAKKHIVVVGGGITGLAACLKLLEGVRERKLPVSITLLERSERVGGNIVARRRDGFLLDGGPDSWVATKPQATALAERLGLGAQIMPTREESRRVFIVWGRELHPLPEGIVLTVPTRIRPIIESRLFTLGAKARMGLEPFIAARSWEDGEDESIGDFITRRLGREVTDRLAAPLLGGIFAGDASKLSIRASFPQFVEAERRYGSLIRAMRAAKRAHGAVPGAKPPSMFLSLRDGMTALVDAVRARLGDLDIRLSTQVLHIDRDTAGGLRLELAGAGTVFADQVIVATPAHVAAEALGPLGTGLAADLRGVPYVSTATIHLAYRRRDVSHPLDASGFIVPRVLGRRILASTWVSTKWESRAPEGAVLLRVFCGGAMDQEILHNDDDALVRIAREELAELMALRAEPLFAEVFRFVASNPQPLVGHLALLGRVRQAILDLPGVHVACSGLDGVGISDCIKQAESAAVACLARC